MPESIQEFLTKYATIFVTVLGIIGGATGASLVTPDFTEIVRQNRQEIGYIQKELERTKADQKEITEKVVGAEKAIISLDANVQEVLRGQEEIKRILREKK